MAEPDTSLGIAVDFDNEGFRRAVRFAMQMGRNSDAPPGEEGEPKAPKFMRRGAGERTYVLNGEPIPPPRLDRDGKPLNPEIDVVIASDEEILTDDGKPIDCAIEVDRADAEELPVGNFRPTKITVTLLDAQYHLVKDCRELIYNGDRYMFGYEPESVGLFEVGVYTMIFYARDES